MNAKMVRSPKESRMKKGPVLKRQQSIKISENCELSIEELRAREKDFKRCSKSITAAENKEIKDCFDLVGRLQYHFERT